MATALGETLEVVEADEVTWNAGVCTCLFHIFDLFELLSNAKLHYALIFTEQYHIAHMHIVYLQSFLLYQHIVVCNLILYRF